MKYLFFILTLSTGFAQSNKTPIDTSLQATHDTILIDNTTFTIIKKLDDTDNNPIENNPALYYDTINTKKTNSELRLKLKSKNNPYKIFKDDLSEGESGAIHTYLGSTENPNLYVVEVKGWEVMSILLIPFNKDTIIHSMGIPKLSPNKRYIASMYLDDSELESFSGAFEIRDIKHNFNSIVYINQSVWAPLDFWWDGNDLRIWAINFDKYNDRFANNYADTFYLRVRLK